MAAELQFSLTELGYKTLISKGLVDTLTYYSLGDFDHNYTIKDADNNILSKITGYHGQLTQSQCGKAKYEGMFDTEPTEEEIINTRSRLEYNFNRIDCDYEFVKPSIQLQVNINTWLNQLSTISSYSYNMEGSLSLELWSYISMLSQKVDLVSSDYKTYETLVDGSFIYTPRTSEDKLTYELVSPKYSTTEKDGTKRVVWKNGKRFNSPLILSFSTNSVNGVNIHGTRGLLSLVTDEWGYYCDGQFLPIQTVEGTDRDNLPWETIYPAVKIAKQVYILKDRESYLTKSRLIGYLYNMVSVQDGSTTALQGLINQTKLFFKSNGTLMPDGSYQTKMSFNVYVNNSKINNIEDIIGNIFTITLSYNESDVTSQTIQLL